MTLGRRKVGASCRFIGFILQAQVGETRPRQPDFLDRGVAVERRKRRPRTWWRRVSRACSAAHPARLSAMVVSNSARLMVDLSW